MPQRNPVSPRAHRTHIPEHIATRRWAERKLALLTFFELETIIAGALLALSLLFDWYWQRFLALWIVSVTCYLLSFGGVVRVTARMTGKVWLAFGENACFIVDSQREAQQAACEAVKRFEAADVPETKR